MMELWAEWCGVILTRCEEATNQNYRRSGIRKQSIDPSAPRDGASG